MHSEILLNPMNFRRLTIALGSVACFAAPARDQSYPLPAAELINEVVTNEPTDRVQQLKWVYLIDKGEGMRTFRKSKWTLRTSDCIDSLRSTARAKTPGKALGPNHKPCGIWVWALRAHRQRRDNRDWVCTGRAFRMEGCPNQYSIIRSHLLAP
jgi:hypothetical protein